MTKDVSNIGVINRTVNMSIKGETEDHWASPLETTASMSGNCVAEAMLKATIAVVSGFPAETMRLALINDNLDDPGHAVLLVLEQNGWVVLDNDTLFSQTDRELSKHMGATRVQSEQHRDRTTGSQRQTQHHGKMLAYMKSKHPPGPPMTLGNMRELPGQNEAK